MEKAKKGLYSLKYGIGSADDITVRIKCGEGIVKEKRALSQWDALTTQCENEEELLELIRTIHVPKRNSKDELIDGHFYISYKNSGEIKMLDVAYSDNEVIKEVSKAYEGKYDIEGASQVKKLAKKLIYIYSKKDPLYQYLTKGHYIDEELSYYLGQYVAYTSDEYYNTNEAYAYFKLITARLKRYKTFRDITYEIHRYNKKIELQNSSKKDASLTEKQKVKTLIPPKGTQMRLFNPNDF